jgi:type IX secretion system PorP/SprF family membrane protein
MMKIKILTLVVLFASIIEGQAQFSSQHTQYMFNPVSYNPGAVGTDKALSVTLNHRTMWRGVDGAPQTDYLMVNTPLKSESFAVGFQISMDKIAVTSNTNAMLTGAYKIPVHNGILSFGLSAGMTNYSNKWSQVVTTEDNDRVFSSGNYSHYMFNAGSGLYYKSKKGFGGISVPYFLTETYAGGNAYKATLSLANLTYLVTGGRRFDIGQKYNLQPSMLLKYHKGASIQADLSLLAGINHIGEAGLSFRPGDAISVIVRGQVNDQLRIGYSYDYLTSQLARYGNGSHEISLNYIFLFKSNAPNTRFI